LTQAKNQGATMKLLHIDSSITGASSASRELSAAAVGALSRSIPNLKVTRRDLDADPVPHLGSKHLAAAKPNSTADRATRKEAETGAAVLQEFLDADIVVIGAPMYNFAIPSQLKAWIDRIVIAGKTFRYSESGAVGLAGGKKVIVVSARGNIYAAGTPLETLDFQERYLRTIFGFIGVEELGVIRAEGIAFSPEHRQKAIAAAHENVPHTISKIIGARTATDAPRGLRTVSNEA
jgi:FMN-dependent NADH-azoreductase